MSGTTRPSMEEIRSILADMARCVASDEDPTLDPVIRAGLADAFGLSGDAEAAALLRPLMQDADPGVARAAMRAVARLGDPRP